MDEFLTYLSESKRGCPCFAEAHVLAIPAHSA